MIWHVSGLRMRLIASKVMRCAVFDDLVVDRCAVPMPPRPARTVGERGPDLAMEAASLVPLIWPGRFVKEQRLGG